MTLNFSKVFQLMYRTSPKIKRSMWKCFYQFLATLDKDGELLFMNYGFADHIPENNKIPLIDFDEKYRLCVQLYHYIVNSVNLREMDVLEVGCGRGGGSSYIKKFLNPRSMIGVDYSGKAIDFCKRNYTMDGLRFLHADAEFLPFEKNTFDVVINIESSRCYGYMERFLREVHRILRPEGYLLCADFRHANEIPELRRQFNVSGLGLIEEELITSNILMAMDLDHERKMRLIHEKAPWFLRKTLENFAGTKDSRIYEMFKNRENEYFNFVLKKTNS